VIGRSMWSHLRSAEFFRPLVDIMPDPVVFLDQRGNILLANSAMEPYVPGFGDLPYGEQSLAGYLDRTTPLKSLMGDSMDGRDYIPANFRAPKKRGIKELLCANRAEVRLRNGMSFTVLVFKKPTKEFHETTAQNKEIAKRTKLKRFEDAGEVDYIGETPEWKAVDAIVDRIAGINANAFILGETGTGKELVARAIHRRSGRPGPFVAINCGAIPRDLFAAELFGYEPGAFTGAKEEGAVGKIEAANHGTVLLDEIGEMPLDLQVGLLRVIQERGVVRLGSTETRPLDVRFLAATNQDVAHMIESREFRSDLYYRLSSIEITLPPLRNRVDDIPRLAEHFNRRLSESLRLDYSPLSKEVEEALKQYTWPGNVRELLNAVERCLIMAGTGSKVSMAHLPVHVVNSAVSQKSFVPASPLSSEMSWSGSYGASAGYGADKGSTRVGSGSDSREAFGRPTGVGPAFAGEPSGFGAPSGFGTPPAYGAPAGYGPIGEVRELSQGTNVRKGSCSDRLDLSPAEIEERHRISKLLLENGGNLSKVAQLMGISRTTLYKRLEYYHLKVRLVVEVDD
ncbi:MAG: sigma 54-interacting transcriptional regulator, partial [Eggerthellales bacterium]|nr:sigma 54-interacting transcriptional regulator [Eggerthellales bacterium]